MLTAWWQDPRLALDSEAAAIYSCPVCCQLMRSPVELSCTAGHIVCYSCWVYHVGATGEVHCPVWPDCCDGLDVHVVQEATAMADYIETELTIRCQWSPACETVLTIGQGGRQAVKHEREECQPAREWALLEPHVTVAFAVPEEEAQTPQLPEDHVEGDWRSEGPTDCPPTECVDEAGLTVLSSVAERQSVQRTANWFSRRTRAEEVVLTLDGEAVAGPTAVRELRYEEVDSAQQGGGKRRKME